MQLHEYFTQRSLTYLHTRLLCPTGLEPNGHGVQHVVSVRDGIAALQCQCERGELLPLGPGRISVEQLSSRSEEIKQIAGGFFPAVSPVRDWRLELSA